MKSAVLFGVALAIAGTTSAQALVPGWLTDPTAVKEALGKDASYQTPEALKYPYISTYYVKPTVTPDEMVKVGVYVTDFDHSRIRFLDDSHVFSLFLEYRLKGGKSKVLSQKGVKSGDAEFNLGKLPVGAYELRVWAKDAKGRESHRVIHDFRVMTAESLKIPADKVYRMTAADLAAYGIRNDGDLEKVVYTGEGKTEVVKEKRAGVPGYTVTVPLDPKTGKVPYRAYEKASVVYDEGYDKAAVEAAAVATTKGLQQLIDEKAAAGFRKFVMLPGTYRITHETPILMPDDFTLDLGKATLKLNAFAGEKCTMLRMASAVDAHVVGGVIEGDYWAHDYKNSDKDSEWVNGFQISGDSWYCSFENVTVREIAGYGGSNYIEKDKRGALAFFCERLPKFAPGGLDRKTGLVDASDKYRFTTDFMKLSKITEKLGRRRLQLSKYLGYQGVRTRSWQATVVWYDAMRNMISSETAWQYREMWIPENAAFMRVSVEAKDAEEANPTPYTEEIQALAIRYPINCAIRNCRFERCRCVGYAAAQMKNWIFEGNFFTTSGEAEAKCAFDAEDGADQMQDAYFLKNVFRDNPVNNSILTCAGHNFILEKNDGSIHFWGRTHSPCVRDNDIEQATYYCDSRIRSGYGRFSGNRHSKGVKLGLNDMKSRPDNWDFVLSGEIFDGDKEKFSLDVGAAGRIVSCTFRNMESVGIANAYACVFENCKGYFSSARWVEVTLKNSKFKNFWGTNRLDRCHIENSTLEGLGSSTFLAKGTDFTNSNILGFYKATLNLRNCTFEDSQVSGGWWARPSDVLFKDCAIKPRKGEPFLVVGAYSIGKFGFDGCTVTGNSEKKGLVHVNDMRANQYGAKEDLLPGMLVFRGTKWKTEAKNVVTHGRAAPNETPSQKKISIVGKANGWSPSVTLVEDLPPHWTQK